MLKEFIITTNTEGADFVVSSFFSYGIDSLKIDDPRAILDFNDLSKKWDYVDETILQRTKTDLVKISAFINLEDIDEIKELVLTDLQQIEGVSFSWEIKDYENVDWLEEWKKYYSPIEVGQYTVVPIWQKDKVSISSNNNTMIYIQPGNAFGTGEHETTKMCLELMSSIDINGKNVVDVGAGSGILGIAALKSGAQKVAFLDIDSACIKSSRTNLQLNDETGQYLNRAVFYKSNLLEKAQNDNQIILANMTADLLINLSKNILNYITKPGYLICSGIIENRNTEVIDAFKCKGFSLMKWIKENAWIALLLSYK
ncbi:MAG TPA: 50S ribosomal protein L11 methyltransferase [Clostridia bacterium]|jgi:ribosomal protein L11 methyltransferase|nr:50S ribosomal protein L11 methyltransferase [Clostridia bacterium]